MNKIRRNDEVVVTTGRDRGKRGKVLKVLENGKVLVSGAQIVKKHVKPNPNRGTAGGILEQEAPIDISNVAIFNAESGKADKVKFRTLEDGTKVRVYKSTGEMIDA